MGSRILLLFHLSLHHRGGGRAAQVVAAYGVYAVADELLHVSGLLALVAMGTWVAAKGRHRISSRVDPALRVVWCAPNEAAGS